MNDQDKYFIQLNPNDNVAIRIMAGGPLSHIPLGHKAALQDIKLGEKIVKYGYVIGEATRDIVCQELVHINNVRMPKVPHNNEATGLKIQRTIISSWDVPTTFKGYLRKDGRTGIRNYILVMANVNCSATVAKAICRHFLNRTLPKSLDGIIPVVHTQGCAQEIGGSGYKELNRTLAGWLFHPNVVGALVVGLGCEQTTFQSILEAASDKKNSALPIEIVKIQDSGGTLPAIYEGIKKVEEIIAKLPEFNRTELPIAKINLALNCGGSDAFSGLTANPALGQVSDFLISHNGTSIFAEIPECHGAEKMLLERCIRDEEKHKLTKIFSWWEEYIKKHNAYLNNNLALGNIDGGITTIIEKSLGAVAKSGISPISEVLNYAEKNTRNGLIIMNTPGFDPVSVTGLVASGCNIVTFSTGRGSTYGCAIAPTLKISTNTELYQKMSEDIDIDAGKILAGRSIELVAQEIFREIINVASGKKTHSEFLGLGWEEFIPWQIGVTL